MTNDDITPDTLPSNEDGEGAVENKEQTEDAPVDTAPKGETGDSPKDGDASVSELSLKELNEMLGKDFPTKDAALKSIKDTFSHVGKRETDLKQDLQKEGYMTREQFENEMFLKDNPGHAANKELLDAIAKEKGLSYSEAAKSESYSKLFESSAKYNEYLEGQSVMDSNPKVAQQKEAMDSVKELMQAGKIDDARDVAAKMVVDAYTK